MEFTGRYSLLRNGRDIEQRSRLLTNNKDGACFGAGCNGDRISCGINKNNMGIHCGGAIGLKTVCYV